MRRRVVFLLLFLFLAVTGLCAADDLLATLRSGHPRLLVTGPDVWTRLRELRKTDPRFAEVVRLIEADAWRLLASPVESSRSSEGGPHRRNPYRSLDIGAGRHPRLG